MADDEATGYGEGAGKRVQAPRGIRRAPEGFGPPDARGIVACMVVVDFNVVWLLLCLGYAMCNRPTTLLDNRWHLSESNQAHAQAAKGQSRTAGTCRMSTTELTRGKL